MDALLVILLNIEGRNAWKQKFAGVTYACFDLGAGSVALPVTETTSDELRDDVNNLKIQPKLTQLPSPVLQDMALAAWADRISKRYTTLDQLVDDYRRKNDEPPAPVDTSGIQIPELDMASLMKL